MKMTISTKGSNFKDLVANQLFINEKQDLFMKADDDSINNAIMVYSNHRPVEGAYVTFDKDDKVKRVLELNIITE